MVLALLWSAGAPAADEQDRFAEILQPAFKARCLKCHGNGETIKGDVNLSSIARASDLTSRPELLEDLVTVLERKTMPPEGEPELSPETREALVLPLRELLEASIAARKSLPRTPIRRMNRFQYSNAVQDLFELNVEVFALPERMLREHDGYFQPAGGRMPETLKAGSRPLGKSQLIGRRLAGVAPFPQDLRAEHGFDNRADHLTLSPLLLESFLKLSRSIVESADFNDTTCGIWNAFFAEPEGEVETAARERLEGFLSRAFRRPVGKEVLDRYTAYVLSRIKEGDSFTAGMRGAASAVLASPRFLYLFDGSSDGEQAERVNDIELASRLSFFLWGSLPDRELLDLASAGTLGEPEVLSAQIERMLNDRRLKRFCDSFPSQWLQLERIISSVPDPERFPEFYFSKYRVSMHMMLEPLLLFETILIENRPILELIDADFSYRSELLESWYATGQQIERNRATVIPFRRVSLNDRREGGVITNAAVMTMTSGPVRTKPITRGAWMASVIFNDPPDPPPADVPPLAEEEDAAESLTLRERFAAHRQRADCAGCHVQIDPLGFALENYGPTGLWRDAYENGLPVDPRGVLFGGREFATIIEFKDAVLSEKQRFTRAFAEHLLSFALGRQIGAADWPALDRIVEETAAAGYRFRPMLKQVILSEPFQQKYNPPLATAHVD